MTGSEKQFNNDLLIIRVNWNVETCYFSKVQYIEWYKGAIISTYSDSLNWFQLEVSNLFRTCLTCKEDGSKPR